MSTTITVNLELVKFEVERIIKRPLTIAGIAKQSGLSRSCVLNLIKNPESNTSLETVAKLIGYFSSELRKENKQNEMPKAYMLGRILSIR